MPFFAAISAFFGTAATVAGTYATVAAQYVLSSSFWINTALSWVIGEIVKDDIEQDLSKYSGALLNKQSNNAQIPVIYGQRKVGGTRVFMATGGTDNAYLYLVLVLCEGEIEEIGDIYINDVISTDSRYSGLVTINKHLGSDSQTVDTMLTGAGVDWTTDHRLRGLAYIACRFKWDGAIFGSVPTVHCVVKGRKVYNPASGSTAYSTNPALCWRDYLTNDRYGKGLSTSAIDDAAVNAAATKCNSLVTPYSGATQIKLFECNAVIDTSKSIMNNCRVFLSGMRGLMPYSEGKYGLVIEDQKVGSTVFDFTQDHIVGGITIQSERKQDKYNRVIATFSNPNKNWDADQIEWPKTNSTDHNNYLSEDNGTELVGRIDLPTITNPYTAEDIAELVVKRSRDALSVAMVVTSEGLKCAVGDIISITHSTPGWDEKEFRVMGITLNADGTVQLECVEHQDNIYPWGTKAQEASTPDTNLPVHFLNNISDVFAQYHNTVNAPSPTYSIGTQHKFWTIFTTPNAMSLSNRKLQLAFSGSINYENLPFANSYYISRFYAGWMLADSNGTPLSDSSGAYLNVSSSVPNMAVVDGAWEQIGFNGFGVGAWNELDDVYFTMNSHKIFANGFSLPANTYYTINNGSLVTSEITQFRLVFGIFSSSAWQPKNVSSWDDVSTSVTVLSR